MPPSLLSAHVSAAVKRQRRMGGGLEINKTALLSYRLGLKLCFCGRISIDNVRKLFAAQCCAWIALRATSRSWTARTAFSCAWLGAQPKFHRARLVALVIAHRATRASQNEL